MSARLRSDSGQSLLEFAIILPLVMMLLLGIIEVGYAMLDQHVVTKLTREGSNLISRDTTISDAVNAMKNMSTRPVNFTDGSSKVIFSVIKRVPTVGSANYDNDIMYQRYEYGGLAKSSTLAFGGGSFGGAPDYEAANSDNTTSLQVTNLPANLTTLGGMLYVTEIYTRHTLITPLDRLGVTLPDTLYSIAYF